MARFRIDDILAESKPEVPIFLSESQLTDETSNLAHESPFGAQRRPPVDQRRLLIQSPSAYQQVETPLITATCRQPLSEEPKQQEGWYSPLIYTIILYGCADASQLETFLGGSILNLIYRHQSKTVYLQSRCK